MTIRKALLKHAPALDLDMEQIDCLRRELVFLAEWWKTKLPNAVAQLPERPSDLLADGKKFAQIAVHAEALARLLDEIGVPGRELLGLYLEGRPGWPEWGPRHLADLDQHYAQWLQPLRELAALTIEKDGRRIPRLGTLSRREAKRARAVGIVRDAAGMWRYVVGEGPQPSGEPFREIIAATLNTIEPGLGRNVRNTIEKAGDLTSCALPLLPGVF